MKRHLPLVPLAVSLFACADQPLTTAPPIAPPSFEIADAARGYKPGFYWLPPMVEAPTYDGVFDPDLDPEVQVCVFTGSDCDRVIATFTRSGVVPGAEDADDDDDDDDDGLEERRRHTDRVRLHVRHGHYVVKWRTDRCIIDPALTYRIRVLVGGIELGYADVDVVSTRREMRNVNTNEYIPLHNGRTLKITFRIETGMVGRVEVQPAESEVEPGATQQFTAILTDLHGNPMSAAVTWASSDDAVATVDQTGLATAIADGVVTIMATSERIDGGATLTVAAAPAAPVVVDAGVGHACALAPSGRAFCWGLNEQGQLGDGSTTTRLAPVPVSGDLIFVAIATGGAHTCGVTPSGQGYCWGSNVSGLLGDGSQVTRLTPVAVSGDLTFATISASRTNTCGVTTDSQGYCWGEGGFGALGNGSPADATAPQPVAGGMAFASITAGDNYTCGVTTAGQGYCWGLGNAGQLGNGTTTNQSVPVAVAGGLTFSTIEAGEFHTCGVTPSGEGYCWGTGLYGRLGNGSTASQTTPQPVSGGLIFASISAGGVHSCGVTTDGTGYCWGGSVDGSLGNGSGLSQLTPSAVQGGQTWATIVASDYLPPTFGGNSPFAFTCGVTADNRPYCWGSNAYGQLGGGSQAPSGMPTPVAEFP
jgi:alpha-tubulin suppressor-like RCC1 family protein